MRCVRAPFRLLVGLALLSLLGLATPPGRSDDKPAPAKDKPAPNKEKPAPTKDKPAPAKEAVPAKAAERPAAETAAKPVPTSSLPDVNPDWLRTLTWRPIGPANMSGRIIDISVHEADPTTYWIATASGGLLKTVNNGITFEHQFDREASVSLGAVCVAPSDRNIVWVGTGEYSPRNSVSYGDGVYRSTDGGKTWTNMGLKKSFQIGRIVIHPKDPNIVYVGALGRLYGPNPERGLFKTTDGGKTWEKILYVDDKTGVIDVRMHPTDPNTLLVATYERQRDGYDTNDPSKKWGPGAGLYKTTDGGKTFRKLTQGLPTCQLGRMGIDYYRKDPRVVFLILESERIGQGNPKAAASPAGQAYMGITGEDAEDAGARLVRVLAGGPAEKAGLQDGDLVIAVGGKEVRSYAQLLEQARERKPGEKVKFKVTRAGKPIEVELTLAARPAGQAGQRGAAPVDPKRPFIDRLGGQQANIQDQQGPDGFQNGGVYRSDDGGETWKRLNSINPRPMYFSCIRVDPNDDKNLYVLGVSLARSTDGGKTFRSDVRGFHADQHVLWINPANSKHMLLGTDGGTYVTYDRMANWDHLNHMALGQFYHVAVDTRPRYRVYGGLQDNGSWGGPGFTTGAAGAVNEDWINVGSGDGFVCRVDPNDPDLVYSESQNGNFMRRHLRTGEVASIRPRPREGQRFRFNWNSPFILSHHNSRIYYCAGNYVFRSLDRGNNLQIISPEVTRTDRGSATALSESPRNSNVLYVGTDDGLLWVTRDGGKEWKNITANVGLPAPFWVATIEASRFEEGRAYVVFDAHRADNDDPHVYVTEDYGQTWRSLRANLPWGSSRVLREDLKNANVLYLGTEFGAWTTTNRGASWHRLQANLPTVAIHEFAQHVGSGDVIAATHGRSLWVLDTTPLRQMAPEVFTSKAHLFEPATAVRWKSEPRRGGTNRRFAGQNPASGAQVYYSLADKTDKVSLKVLDYTGKTIRELPVRKEPGLHRIAWDLTLPPQRQPGLGTRTGGQSPGRTGSAPAGRRSGGAGEARPEAETPSAESTRTGGGPTGPGTGPVVAPGMYRVVLSVDGKEFTQGLRIEADPTAPPGYLTAEQQIEEEAEEEAHIDH